MEAKIRFNTKCIDDYIQKNNISKQEFCNRCGISMFSLNSIYQHKRVSIIKIYKIAVLMKVSTDALMMLEKK